jgi:DNA-binding MarR family transcriptional regulator
MPDKPEALMDLLPLPSDALLLDNQLCFSLYAASRKVIQLYTPHLTRLDLTYTQYITLMVLWEQPLIPVKHLGEKLLLDSGTLTPVLKKMEKKGLLTRRRSSQDERSVLIELTEQGADLKQEALAFLPSLSCGACLSLEELVEMRELARKLVDGLRQND